MSYPERFRLPLPPATRALFLANVAVFVANALLFGRLSDPGRGAWFAFSWDGMWAGYGIGALRVVTYQFTHSFADVMHLLTNLLALWVFGPIAESRLGSVGTGKLYLACGACGAIGHLAAAALCGSGEPVADHRLCPAWGHGRPGGRVQAQGRHAVFHHFGV